MKIIKKKHEYWYDELLGLLLMDEGQVLPEEEQVEIDEDEPISNEISRIAKDVAARNARTERIMSYGKHDGDIGTIIKLYLV